MSTENTQSVALASVGGGASGSRFVWHGDLADDCWCRDGNLLAHCECMGEIKWRDIEERRLNGGEIWFVSVGPVDADNRSAGDDLFHSGEPGGLIIGGEMARAIAEAILSANAEVSNPKERQ